MTSPNIADLKAAFFGGGTDEEYQWLLDAQANGLTAQSLLDGSAYSGAFLPLRPRVPASGAYLQNQDALRAVDYSLNTAGWSWFDRILIPYTGTITKMAVNVETAGGAGAVIRLGLYDEDTLDDATDMPLLGDFGTVAGDSLGNKEVTGLSIPVEAGQIVRPIVKWDGGGTAPSVSGWTTRGPSASLSQILTASSGGTALNVSTATGAFPATLGPASATTSCPRTAVWVVPS